MAENRNVVVVGDFEGIMRPQVRLSKGAEDASERNGNSESWEKA